MQKVLKRTFALILALMLCLSAMPFSAFAADVQPDAYVPSEVEAVVEPDEPDLTASPDPDGNSSPRGSPEEQEESPADPDTKNLDETSSDPVENELVPGTEFGVDQVWPAVRRMQARSAAYGTSGTSMWVIIVSLVASVRRLLWGNTSDPCPLKQCGMAPTM